MDVVREVSKPGQIHTLRAKNTSEHFFLVPKLVTNILIGAVVGKLMKSVNFVNPQSVYEFVSFVKS